MIVQDKLMEYELFDVAIIQHGFVPFMRDYDLIVEADWKDGLGKYVYRFTHCLEAHITSSIRDDVWPISWDDINLDYPAWAASGTSEGFVWGVGSAIAYPGLTYQATSLLARDWSVRLGKLMHEVSIETNVFCLRLIFHDVVIRKLNDEINILNKMYIPIRNV